MSDRQQDQVHQWNPNDSWFARNATRLLLVLGFFQVFLSAWTLLTGGYLVAVMGGVIGFWILGGWPAIRRLVTNPKMQLVHWYHILRDTRQVHTIKYGDGSKKVAIMKPVRRDGWGWTEDRWFNRD